MTDYDLYIYDKDGTLVTKQETNSECHELAKFIAPSTGTYTAKIVKKVLEEICDNQDRLISFNNEIISYDEMGRPLIYRNKELTWNNQN